MPITLYKVPYTQLQTIKNQKPIKNAMYTTPTWSLQVPNAPLQISNSEPSIPNIPWKYGRLNWTWSDYNHFSSENTTIPIYGNSNYDKLLIGFLFAALNCKGMISSGDEQLYKIDFKHKIITLELKTNK